MEEQYTGDLRNRVVGARLQKAGRLPYFYKWTPKDSTRYYDPASFDNLKVSNITSTPFLHHLMLPLVEMPQLQISRWWFVLEYLFFFATGVLAFSFAKNNLARICVCVTGLLFLFTEAWKMHMAEGQYYIIIPFLAMLFYYLMNKKQNYMALLAGAVATVLIFIRPNAIFFFIPFIFIMKDWSRLRSCILLLPIVVCVAWSLLDAQERLRWTDFRAMVGEQIKDHQNLNPTRQNNNPNPQYSYFEGIKMTPSRELPSEGKALFFSENGNVFVLFNQLFHKKIPVAYLAFFSASFILVYLGMLYYFRIKPGLIAIPNLAMAGYCLYMISDLFSPIYRHQYYTIQWLFPLLLAATVYKPSQKWLYALLLLGLILNVLNVDFIKMEHTIGEYIFLLILAILSFAPQPKTLV